MYNYILDFLSQRSIRVKVGDAVSAECIVENGIPQGSAISPILFNIMINDIYENLGDHNDGLLYADYAVIWRRGHNISYVNSKMQRDAKTFIKAEISLRWQDEWDSESKGRYYHNNQSSIGGKRIISLGLNRQEEVVLTRLRLGHTGLNATLSLMGISGICSECKVLEDVTHVLFYCKKYEQFRQVWLDERA